MTLKEFGTKVNEILDGKARWVTFDGVYIKGWVVEPVWHKCYNLTTNRHDDEDYEWLNFDPTIDVIWEFRHEYTDFNPKKEYGYDIDDTDDFSACKEKLY